MDWALSRRIPLLLTAVCLAVLGAALFAQLPAQLLPGLSTNHFVIILTPRDTPGSVLPPDVPAFVGNTLTAAGLPGSVQVNRRQGWYEIHYIPLDSALLKMSKITSQAGPESDASRESLLSELLRYEANRQQLPMGIKVEAWSASKAATLTLAVTKPEKYTDYILNLKNNDLLKHRVSKVTRVNTGNAHSLHNGVIADFYSVTLESHAAVRSTHTILWNILNQQLGPTGMAHVHKIHDEADKIDAAESTVTSNLRDGTVLTCLCVFLFLRSLRSTIFVSLSLPLSLLAAIPFMTACGLGKNIMSLAGLALGVGVVVDATLAVMEDFHAELRGGTSAAKAAKSAARSNFAPVLAAILTTLAVFVPILFLNGFAGDIFFDLSMTIIIIQLLSFGVAIYLTPGILSLYYEKVPESIQNMPQVSNSELAPNSWFVDFMEMILRSRAMTLGFFLASLLAVVWSLTLVPGSEFLPAGKQADFVFLKPVGNNEKMQTIDEMIQNTSTSLHTLALSSSFVVHSDHIEVRLKTSDAHPLERIQNRLQLGLHAPTSALLPVDASGEPAGVVTLYIPPQSPENFLKIKEKLSHIKGIFNIDSSPASIWLDGFPRQILRLTLSPGMISGTAISKVKESLKNQMAVESDPVSALKEQSLLQLGWCVLFAMALIFIILLVINRSFYTAITIMFTFLWGLIGVFPGMRLHGESFNASVLVGFILLSGTVVNNGILLMDLFMRHRAQQLPPFEAMMLAIRKRAIPVIVTALTTVLGMVPMVFETGEGSELYRGLAIVTVYGTLVSTPLSIICLPCLALLLDDFEEFKSRMKFFFTTYNWEKRILKRYFL